jgi:hypothetical protein
MLSARRATPAKLFAVVVAFAAVLYLMIGCRFAPDLDAAHAAELQLGKAITSGLALPIQGEASVARMMNSFSWNNVIAGASSRLQNAVGASGSSYNTIATGFIVGGHVLDLFNDGSASLVPSSKAPVSVASRSLLASASANVSWSDLYGGLTNSHTIGFTTQNGAIIPTGMPSLLASLAQIDAIGDNTMGVIRILTSYDAAGHPTAYTVLIPSTQKFTPFQGSLPNDLTSGLYAMRYGDQSALAGMVYQAMQKAGIPTGVGAPPVTLAGFSLGGITAAAIAANRSNGYNIVAVDTAGAPIANFAIPSSVKVTALEATQDIVPSLDGRANPTLPNWTTVRQSAAKMAGERTLPVMDPAAVHTPNRYAAMARNNPSVAGVGAVDAPPGGRVASSDFYTVRH